MARNKVAIASTQPDRTLRLSDLRQLVEIADAMKLPDDSIVRGSAVPFRLTDLGNLDGSSIQKLAVVQPERNPS